MILIILYNDILLINLSNVQNLNILLFYILKIEIVKVCFN
jgi:hypothetical protein